MFISHGVWLLRTRSIRRRAKEAELAFDEFPEAISWQQSGFKVGTSLCWMRVPMRFRRKPNPDVEGDISGTDQGAETTDGANIMV